jgi:hypothetical protein
MPITVKILRLNNADRVEEREILIQIRLYLAQARTG